MCRLGCHPHPRDKWQCRCCAKRTGQGARLAVARGGVAEARDSGAGADWGAPSSGGRCHALAVGSAQQLAAVSVKSLDADCREGRGAAAVTAVAVRLTMPGEGMRGDCVAATEDADQFPSLPLKNTCTAPLLLHLPPIELPVG